MWQALDTAALVTARMQRGIKRRSCQSARAKSNRSLEVLLVYENVLP